MTTTSTLTGAETRIPILEALYKSDPATFRGTIRRGVPNGAGIIEARAIADSLAGQLGPMASQAEHDTQRRLLARARSICT